MAPRGAGVAKKQAGAKANPKGAPGANLSAVDSELDESKFASLTTDMCLPHYFGRKTPLEIPKPEPQEMLANFPAGLIVDKGQAGPSVIQPSPAAPPMDESTWSESAEGQVQAGDGDLFALRDEVEALRAALTERDAALAELHAVGVQARESWTQEAEDWFREAEEAWKAGEAARLAAAEAEWRERSASALAQARSEAETARTETEDELRRAREESHALKATLNERDTALAEMRAAGEQARDSSAQAHDLLREAEQAWKAGEAERLKAAEAKWQEQSIAALAQARSEVETARKDADAARHEATAARSEGETARNQIEDELRRAREESAALKATLTERDTALAHMRAAGEQVRESRTQAQDALREAEQAWKAGEAARLAAAEAKWRENSISSLTRVRTEAQAARTQSDDELRRVREETAALKASLAEEAAALKATLAERDAKLAGMQSAEQAAAALAKAHASWKADEAARFAASEAQWRKQAASAVADATARYEAAEGALAQLRQDAARERSSTKIELTQVRSAIPAERRSRRGSRMDDDAPRKKHTGRDVLVVAALAASAIIFYPSIVPYLPQSVRSNLATVTAGIGPINAGFSTSSAALPDGAAHAVVARDVNLRASPAAAGKIVTTLARGVKVTTLEKKGNWTSVQVESDKSDAKPVQGWVFNSFLKEEAAGEDTE